ncbi:Phosphodiesterase I [Handroanthus impetiginosus]|uniref:Phosphodiesterase I n=1 Tax=Handroanthus impetiginosus TaxID=429701 RepID=A0A2G9HU31_9LAMI|nr:Phosphodiesterase I [Handroanthus impetiginosus]
MKQSVVVLLLLNLLWSVIVCSSSSILKLHHNDRDGGKAVVGEQPLSKIAIRMTVVALRDSVSIKAYPLLVGLKGEDTEWVDVELENPAPSEDDWVGVFSPAKFK